MTNKLSAKDRLAALKARTKPAEAAYVEGGKPKTEEKVDKSKRVKTGGRKKATEINLKQREFVDLYIGGPDELRGNATACYRHLHPRLVYRLAKPSVSDSQFCVKQLVSCLSSLMLIDLFNQATPPYDNLPTSCPCLLDVCKFAHD
jgi:hypothetical protein